MIGPALRRNWQYSAKKLSVEFLAPGGAASRVRTGTAFVLFDNAKLIVLVTNAHMVDPARTDDPLDGYHPAECEISSWVAPSNGIAPPLKRRFAKASFEKDSKRIAISESEDVAAIAFTRHEHKPSAELHKGDAPDHAEGCFITDWTVKAEALATDEYLSRFLSIGSPVGVFGFPKVAGIEFDERPVGIFGTVASDPRVTNPTSETPGRAVLYQAMSRMGMSGGIVVADEYGLRLAGDYEGERYQSPKVVGVNAGHLYLPKGEHAGLSYFYRADAIREVLSQLESPLLTDAYEMTPRPEWNKEALTGVATHYGCLVEDLTLEHLTSCPEAVRNAKAASSTCEHD